MHLILMLDGKGGSVYALCILHNYIYTYTNIFNNRFILPLLHFLFVKTAFFRVALGSQENWGEGRDFSYTACLSPQTHKPHPTVHILPQSGTWVTTDEPTLTRQYYLSPQLTWGLAPDTAPSRGLDKCAMTYPPPQHHAASIPGPKHPLSSAHSSLCRSQTQ